MVVLLQTRALTPSLKFFFYFLLIVLALSPTLANAQTQSRSTELVVTCPALSRCRLDPTCRRCLLAVQPYATYALAERITIPEQILFFNTLQSDPACLPVAVAPSPPPTSGSTGAIGAAAAPPLIAANATLQALTACNFGWCQAAQYACFLDRSCRQCLADVYNNLGRSGAVLTSPACVDTDQELLVHLALGRHADHGGMCRSFAGCSFTKLRCSESPGCVRGWDALQRGNATEAHDLTTADPERNLMRNLVYMCGFDQVSCAFTLRWCASTPFCAECLAAMSSQDDPLRVVDGSMSESCLRIRELRSMGNASSYRALEEHMWTCPLVPTCEFSTFLCVMNHYPLCGSCLKHTAGPNETATCNRLIGQDGYSIADSCKGCPTSVTVINRLVLVTCATGLLSVAGCIAVILVIVANERDRHSMRERIILGLVLANMMYSIANMVPINYLHTTTVECGKPVLPYATIRLWRAWWFGAKFALVCFEGFILGASIWALEKSRFAPPRWEAAVHISCTVGGVCAFVGFYLRCLEINKSGYNEGTQTKAETVSFSNVYRTDDVDDDEPSLVDIQRFKSARSEYDMLEQEMLQVWLCCLGTVIAAWVYLRVVLARQFSAWQEIRHRAVVDEAADSWATTRKSEWLVRQQQLEMQKEAYTEVARPLEPYVLIFLVFGVPAAVMATDFCADHSGASTVGHSDFEGVGSITYGECDVWCELVLAFRSIATVLVYFMSGGRRAELLNARPLLKRLSARVLHCCQPRRHNDAPAANTYALLPKTQSMSSNHRVAAEKWLISWGDIKLEHALADGTFGCVWQARFQKDTFETMVVAVKVLKFGSFGNEDDADLEVDEEFRQECKMLTALDHPQLIKFFGFGTTTDEYQRGFLVTELMPLGSLRGVLDNENIKLPWTLRWLVAEQISLGMEHLHSIPIVHRDLKSDNVLLDERYNAKVTDFGTSRKFRPSDPVLLTSAFTGVTRRVSMVPGRIDDDKGWTETATETASVGAGDLSTTLTGAVGTLLWQAPELFRGDRHYTNSVDVYSYGIILYEIATRRLPWVGEIDDDDYMSTVRWLEAALKADRRPALPSEMEAHHPEFVDVMRQCWAGDPGERPSFSSVVAILRGVQGVEAPHGEPSVTPRSATSRNMQPSCEGSLSQPLLREPW